MAAGNSVNGNFSVGLTGSYAQSTTMLTATAPINNLNTSQALTGGTGTNQADTLYTESGTLTASTPRTIQIFSSSTLYDVFGNLLALAACKLFMVWNLDSTNVLTVGAAGSNPWTGFLNGSSTVIVPPGGGFAVWGFGAGMTVSSGSENLKLDPGSNSIAYKLMILGIS